ncbi:MAG: 2-succinyl-6-hydroxy-2,4-cyclohexadiene-1-carboxylate synthase [Bacteroidota bacterium]
MGTSAKPAPTVWLHGFMGSGADWSDVTATLPGEHLAIDLPGHGANIGLPDAAYTMAGATAQLLATLDAKGWDSVNLVGYSMGGRLALYIAVHHPERIRRLVLISASPGLKTEAERAARRAVDAERAEAIAADFDAFLDQWYTLPVFDSLPDDVAADQARRKRANDPHELAKSLRFMGTGSQPSLSPRLADVAMPTTLILGARDAKFIHIAQAMKAANDAFDLRVIAKAGHMVHIEQPQALIREVLSVTSQER